MKRIKLKNGDRIRKTQFIYIKEGGLSFIGGKNRRLVNVKCDCGVKKTIPLERINLNNTRSCGCYLSKIIRTHGLTSGVSSGKKVDRIYKTAGAILQRCNNPKNYNYKRYGGRGIKCEWNNIYDLYKYLASLPNYTNKTTIDRINNNLGYVTGNLRWVSQKENCRNRSTAFMVEYNGIRLSLTEMCEKLNLPYSIIQSRIYTHKWDIKRSLEQPIRHFKNYENK